MIVKVVAETNTCFECPNFVRRPFNSVHDENYICQSLKKVIGNSESIESTLKLRNRVSDLCPHKNDEVNQRPRREK